MHHNLGSGAEDIGLVYMAARWYAPTLGRFISADTLIPDPANPQSYNRYSYVENRPSYYTDPSGHCPWCLGAIAGAIGGAVTSYVGQVVSNYQSGGMTLTEALTTDIDPGKIVAGAVGGAIIGGTFGGAAVAAGGGTLAGVGLGQLTMYGAVSGLAAGQASALIEASIHHYDGWDTDINSLIQDAHSLGFFDMETVMIDTVSGAVAGFVAGTSSKLFHSLAKNFGIEPIIRDIDANGNVIQEMYLSKPLERNVFVRFLEILNTLGIERAARYLASQTSALTEEELEQIIP